MNLRTSEPTLIEFEGMKWTHRIITHNVNCGELHHKLHRFSLNKKDLIGVNYAEYNLKSEFVFDWWSFTTHNSSAFISRIMPIVWFFMISIRIFRSLKEYPICAVRLCVWNLISLSMQNILSLKSMTNCFWSKFWDNISVTYFYFTWPIQWWSVTLAEKKSRRDVTND